MGTQPRLRKTVVEQAPAQTARYELAEPSGLALRVTPKGARSFVWRYRAPDGTQRRLTLGTYPAVPLAEARARLTAAQKALAAGQDPAAGRLRGETVADL